MTENFRGKDISATPPLSGVKFTKGQAGQKWTDTGKTERERERE